MKSSSHFLIKTALKLAIVLHLFKVTSATSSAVSDSPYDENEAAEEILNKIFHVSYNKNVRPSGVNGSGPTIVRVNPLIRRIDYIDDVNMEYGLEMTLRQQWLDKRLAYTNITRNLSYVTLLDKSKLWQPDLFFSNEKRGHIHEVLSPNYMIRISPDGQILTSIRITLNLKCPMDLKLYPFDKPTCSLFMASYSWSQKDLIFTWKEKNPVEMKIDATSLARFQMKSFNTSYCDSNTITGIYTCIQLDFYFDRNFTYYLMQIYIPSCMIVIISWLSFWLDERATDARISLGVTSILTMVTQIYGINQSSPSVSYMKALDVWTATCQIFVVGTLLEFSLVNHAQTVSPYKYQESQKNESQQFEIISDANINTNSASRRKRIYNYLRKCSKAKRIDLLARTLFPLTFLSFNFVYWLVYFQ